MLLHEFWGHICLEYDALYFSANIFEEPATSFSCLENVYIRFRRNVGIYETTRRRIPESLSLHALLLFKKCIKHLKTKRRLLYLKTQSVPRCKHFSSRL